MAINVAYYSSKVEQIKLVITLLGDLKGMLIPILQFVEDAMPEAKGADKLKAAMNFIQSALDDSEELKIKLDSIWGVFTGAVSAFVVIQKAIGGLVVKKT